MISHRGGIGERHGCGRGSHKRDGLIDTHEVTSKPLLNDNCKGINEVLYLQGFA